MTVARSLIWILSLRRERVAAVDSDVVVSPRLMLDCDEWCVMCDVCERRETGRCRVMAKERERGREGERQRGRDREDSGREAERGRERGERKRQRETQRKTERHKERHTERHTGIERQTHRERERQREREREKYNVPQYTWEEPCMTRWS